MVSRRGFLGGVGAAAAAATLPLHRLGTRAQAQSSSAPLRLVLWPSMNGCDPAFFWPSPGNHGAMSLVTEPLKAYQRQLTFVSGLDIDGSMNHMAVRSMFTGFPVADYGSPDPTVKSLDQVVRDVIQASAPTQVPSLHLGARPADSYQYYKLFGRSTFFFSPTAVDYEANPVAAFDRTFRGASAGTPPPSATPGVDQSKLRNAVLALQKQELEGLHAQLNGSPVEQLRLELHSASIQKLVRDAADIPVAPPIAACDATPLPSVEGLRSELQGNDPAAYQDRLFERVFDAQVDIMARALTCGITRVATLQAGSADGNVIVPIDGGYPHHNTSHGDQQTFARCQQWYATKFLRLLKALDVPDPLDPSGKTVLYNSAIVWLSECLPSSHASADVPCFVAGNAGGRLAAGGYIDAQGATNKHLLKTLALMFGASDGQSAHFGDNLITELRA